MKKTVLIIVSVMLCLSLSGCFSYIKEMAKMEAELDAKFDKYCPPAYVDKDIYSEGIRDITEYSRYYYASDIADQLMDTGYQTVLDDEDRENVISYFQRVKEYLSDKSRFDFDDRVISDEDLYAYFKYSANDIDYDLFFYDRDSHTLYYLRNST